MKNRILTADNIIVFILSFFILSWISYNIGSDIEAHVDHITKINKGEADYPANFFYYLLINLLSFQSTSINVLLNVAIVVLTIAVTAKYIITKRMVFSNLGDTLTSKNNINRYIILAAGVMLLMFAIPDYLNLFEFKNRYYLGRIVPNVWHNSTTIFLFPFALLLYHRQQAVIMSDKEITKGKDIVIICGLVVLNIIIKPSFFFVLMPVTSLFLLIKYKLGKQFFYNMIPMFLGLALILVQYILIYKFQQGSFHETESSVIIDKPFVIWRIWIPLFYIPIAFIMSNVFPLLFISFNYRSILNQKYLYPLLMSLWGLIMFVFIREYGARTGDGNFMWQNIITQYIFMLILIIEVLREFLTVKKVNLKLKLLIGAIGLHTLAGIGYLIKIFMTGDIL